MLQVLEPKSRRAGEPEKKIARCAVILYQSGFACQLPRRRKRFKAPHLPLSRKVAPQRRIEYAAKRIPARRRDRRPRHPVLHSMRCVKDAAPYNVRFTTRKELYETKP